MSNLINQTLMDRAHYVKEQYAGTALPEVIDRLIEENDLERLDYMLREAEYELSIEDFHNSDALPKEFEDVY